MVSVTRAGLALIVAALAVGLGACAAPSSTPPSEPSTTAAPAVSDEWVTAALALEVASIDTWTDAWFDKICGSATVASGDRACTDHATSGAMLASNAPERIASLRAAGVDAIDLIDPAGAAYTAAEAFFARLCDRAPTTDCIGPVDDLTSALATYADALRDHLADD